MGITVVNASETFVSPLRQRAGKDTDVTQHNQPHVTEKMVKHLRALRVRSSIEDVGFDAYATIVVNCDNVSAAKLLTESPAPQPGEADHYGELVKRIVQFYGERFSDLL